MDDRAGRLKAQEAKGWASSIDLRSGLWLPIGVVVGLIVFFSLASDAFLTVRNMTGILGRPALYCWRALGQLSWC